MSPLTPRATDLALPAIAGDLFDRMTVEFENVLCFLHGGLNTSSSTFSTIVLHVSGSDMARVKCTVLHRKIRTETLERKHVQFYFTSDVSYHSVETFKICISSEYYRYLA